jgi:hypothetical protein
MLGNDVIGHQCGSSALSVYEINGLGLARAAGKALGINLLRNQFIENDDAGAGLRSASPGPPRFMRHTAALPPAN